MFETIMMPVERLGAFVENALGRLIDRLDAINIKRFM